MKKLFVFAALVLTASAVVFAQELKFDGYINSGLGVVASSSEDKDTYVKAFGVDSDSNGYRFRLNGSFTNEAKNAGARFRLQGQRDISQSGFLSMPYLYGWVGFFDNKLTVTGGLVMDSTWESADWWWADDAGEGLGLLIKGEPIKGLNLGFGAYTISQQSGGSNNSLVVTKSESVGKDSSNADVNATTTKLPNFGEMWLRPNDMKYVISASYTMPEKFRLGATFRTQNKAGWRLDKNNYSNNELYDYGGREESMYLQAELRLLMVKNLTAVIVGTFDHLEKNDTTSFDKKGNIVLSETFGYKLDDLNVGLNAVQFIYSRTDDTNPGLLFNPWVSYTLGKAVPRLDLVYFYGGRSKTAADSTKIDKGEQWERRGFSAVEKTKSAEDDRSVFSVRPSVKLNLDSKTFLEIGDMINIDFGEKDGAYKDSGDANKKTLVTNVFYVDVKISF